MPIWDQREGKFAKLTLPWHTSSFQTFQGCSLPEGEPGEDPGDAEGDDEDEPPPADTCGSPSKPSMFLSCAIEISRLLTHTSNNSPFSCTCDFILGILDLQHFAADIKAMKQQAQVLQRCSSLEL